MRNWQGLHRGENSRTKGSMSLLERSPSVTVPSIKVDVEVGGNVLRVQLNTEWCPSELIIICAASTPWFHIRKLEHEPSPKSSAA